jgi:hypothetical protein
MIDTQSTSLSFGLQAATPAGLENQGVAGGPTLLNPSLAYFQELQGGAAFQSFVCKNQSTGAHWSEDLERSVRYGIAFQQPLPLLMPTGHSLHFFVEGLGRIHANGDLGKNGESPWEVLPGLHWQGGENWFLSGGFIVPVERHGLDPDLWQITWSLRF